jgi:hypothetical protein
LLVIGDFYLGALVGIAGFEAGRWFARVRARARQKFDPEEMIRNDLREAESRARDRAGLMGADWHEPINDPLDRTTNTDPTIRSALADCEPWSHICRFDEKDGDVSMSPRAADNKLLNHAPHCPGCRARTAMAIAGIPTAGTPYPRPWRVLVALVMIGASVTVASAAPGPGTWAWNYRNQPIVAPLAGYEFVILSPRGLFAAGVLDSLNAMGVRPLVWLQPTLAVVNGAPIQGAGYPWDTAVLELVTRHGAILRTPDGAPADLFPGDPRWDAWLLDYRDTAFVDEFAALILERLVAGRSAGILWDYGCGDISWNPAIGIDAATWAAWRAGFVRLVGRVKAGGMSVIHCDQYPADLVPVSSGVRYEQAGMSLNPLSKVWKNVTAHPDRVALVGVEELIAQKRRAFATLSLMTGSRFNWSDLRGDTGGGTQDKSYPDYEHFVLDVGPTAGGIRTRGGGCYSRNFKRGIAVLNTSSSPHAYYLTSTVKVVVQPGDGLVMQTRDALGRYITRITNEGR